MYAAAQLAALLLTSCSQESPEATAQLPSASVIIAQAPPIAEPRQAFNPRLLRRFSPLRARLDTPYRASSQEQVDLGRMLFFDKRLSKSASVSCNTCHRLSTYGVDGERTSLGADHLRGVRNSPTVYNAAGAFVQTWDGRASDVEGQVESPLLNSRELAMPSKVAVVARLKQIPGYVTAFEHAFPADAEPISFDNVGRAIGAFERGLTTPSRWDRYLKGEKKALHLEEIEGLRLFTNVGCMVCHTGELLGGTSYQRAGVVEPWPNQNDKGRAAITTQKADNMLFKVPSLRNVEQTAPYFHDGSAATLPEAVRMMGKHQLGLELADDEVASITAWLHTLTGELPERYVAEPELPPDPPRLRAAR